MLMLMVMVVDGGYSGQWMYCNSLFNGGNSYNNLSMGVGLVFKVLLEVLVF